MNTLNNEILLPFACSCHVIDSQKMQVLLWKRIKADKSTYYLLKIAEQRFIGLVRTDKKGEVYWKFRNFTEDEPNLENELNPVDKFHQRQEQVNNFQNNKEIDGKPTNSEINTNSK